MPPSTGEQGAARQGVTTENRSGCRDKVGVRVGQADPLAWRMGAKYFDTSDTKAILMHNRSIYLILAFVVACGGNVAINEDSPDIRENPELLHSYTAFLSSSMLTPEQQILVGNAENILIEQCMAQRGFEIRRPRYGPANTATQDPTTGLVSWLFDDVDAAGELGYGLAETRAAAERRDADDTATQGVTDISDDLDAQEALVGTKEHRFEVQLEDGTNLIEYTDGCVTQANDALFGDTETRMRLFLLRQSYRLIFWERLRDHPDVRAALSDWQGCMADQGYSVASPGEARNLAAGEEGTSQQSFAIEVAIASADAQCNNDSGLASTVGKITPLLLEDIAAKESSSLSQMGIVLDQAIEEAARVVAP